MIYPWSESGEKKSKWRNTFDDVIICAIVVVWTKNVFWSKIYFGALANSLILNHLTSNFQQYFFDKSLIRIRKKKKSNWRKSFNDVMTEECCDVMIGDNIALNIYQLNINNTLLFMHKVKNNNTPNIFKQSFNINTNKYNTKSTNTKFHKPLLKTKYNQ